MAKKDLFGTICPGIVPESERPISYFFSAKRQAELMIAKANARVLHVYSSREWVA